MKTLYIVRHAKSSWDQPGLADDERPLLQKGIKRTLKIARYLQSEGISVDHMISSHAVRALETAKIVSEALSYPVGKISISQQMYHGNTDHLYDELFGLSDNIDSVMIFGHNPTFTNFANHFLDEKIDWLPTSALVSVIFDTDSWTDLPMASRKVNFVITPRQL
ncbi:MAG: histidine phosphatase family protein [Bacteroidota bacterium]